MANGVQDKSRMQNRKVSIAMVHSKNLSITGWYSCTVRPATRPKTSGRVTKARYDAEVWYYRGNGAVDIIADKDFNPAAYANRGV